MNSINLFISLRALEVSRMDKQSYACLACLAQIRISPFFYYHFGYSLPPKVAQACLRSFFKQTGYQQQYKKFPDFLRIIDLCRMWLATFRRFVLLATLLAVKCVLN